MFANGARAMEFEIRPAEGNASSLGQALAQMTPKPSLTRPLPTGDFSTGKFTEAKTLVRLRGLLIPPATGEYRLAVAGDDAAILYLSDDKLPYSRKPIASFSAFTKPRQWDASPGQISAPIHLEAGVPRYVEAWCFNLQGDGGLDIGWSLPGSKAIVPITLFTPSNQPQVIPYQLDADDQNDNGLPDSWEKSCDLDPASGSFGDPDNDGASNLQEYQAKTNPLKAESFPGKVLEEAWTDVPGGGWMQRNRLTYEHLQRPPTVSSLRDGMMPGEYHLPCMHKLRAYLVPPVSGEYRFHIVGQGKMRFSISPDENVLHQRQLIEGGSAQSGTRNDVNDPFYFNDSDPVPLEAGSRHFVEVIFYQEATPSGFKLEWRRPDGVQECVPVTAFQSFVYAEGDRNHDDLPDSWQSEHNLDISGKNPEHYASGDADHDGLTNGEEFLAGTNPGCDDTDGDGVSDQVEVKVLGTSPLDGKSPVEAAPKMDIFAVRPLTYSWSRAESGFHKDSDDEDESWKNLTEPLPDPRQPSLACATGCGSAEFNMKVDKAGIHLFSFHYQLTGNRDMVVPMDIQWWIDNQRLPDTHDFSHPMSLVRVSFLTPWLSRGKHTLRFKLRQRVERSVTHVYKVNLDRIRDGEFTEQVKKKLAEANSFSAGIGQSLTSPASVDFTSRIQQLTPLKSGKKNLPVSLIGVATSHAEVELPVDGSPCPLSAKVENRALTLTGSVRWDVTNVFGKTSLDIRQGDALRLAATPDGCPAEGVGTLVINGKEFSASLKHPLMYRFESAGRQEIVGRFAKDGKMVESKLSLGILPRSATLDVGWSIGGGKACKVHALDKGVEIDGLGVVAVTLTQDGTRALSPKQAGDFLLPIRLGNHGAVIGLVKVRSCELDSTCTWNPERTTYVDGSDRFVISKESWVVSALLENPPPGARVHFSCDCPPWRPLPFDGKKDTYLPVSSVNEEDIINFYAASPSGPGAWFQHELRVVMPDGAEKK
jgi:hypothetical protein